MKSLTLVLLLICSTSFADEVRILEVGVECPRACTFTVTLQHADQGWDHFADLWEVVTLDDQLLAARVLYHPHVDEQPFTRSLSGVVIPEGMRQVKIRARDSVHGYSEQEVIVDIPG